MIRRETDPQLMSCIANANGVREFVSIEDAQPDWETLAKLQALDEEHPGASFGIYVVSNGRDAMAIFTETASGIFQGHTMFAQSCRGRQALDTGKDILSWMFGHGAEIIWGCTPRDNRKAIWFNRQLGMHELPTSDENAANFEIRRGEMH